MRPASFPLSVSLSATRIARPRATRVATALQWRHIFGPLAPFIRYLGLCGIALLLLCGVPGCEDQPPFAYEPVPYVEGYLFVDQPIDGITVAWSQSLGVPYDAAAAMERNAIVTVSTDSAVYPLTYHEHRGIGSYRCADSTILVRPRTRYTLSVQLPDGRALSAETVTPERIAWTRPPQPLLQYPSDTLTLPSPDSLRVSWTQGNTVEFLIRVRCVDTAGYGAYLAPPTDELNGRTNNLASFETPERRTFYGTTRWGFVQTTQAPTVWTAFRWYGRNAVAILAPDKHFMDWFKLTRFSGNPQYNAEYSNIRGGAGVFGSAAVAESEVFLRKRMK
jgi:hypothetical protein